MNWLFLSAIVLGLSMSITSCKDDDDDSGNNREQKEQEDAGQASMKFWDVVGQLVGTSVYTADYKDKTFEPLIGTPDETNPLTRFVATNDMASAAQNFADLVNENIDPNESQHTWSDPDVGTLTYHKTNDGKSWAEVEVDIPQIPTLKKIIYRSSEQSGDNAAKGDFNCCYRFGDVIRRVYTDSEDGNKQKTEYWVCVRPAFGPEGKGDSHWISLSPLPKKHIWEKEDSKNRVHRLPTGIGVSEKHMQNLAEMLYTMFNSESWRDNVLDYPAPTLFKDGLRMFYDFSHNPDMVTYHSPLFWEYVLEAWKTTDVDGKDLFQLIFGKDYEEVRKFTEDDGLHLLAHGYSWKTLISWNLTLYEYKYADGEGYKSNMHDVTYRKVEQNMENFDNYIDVSTQYTADKPYLENSAFFGDNQPRYIIRHATGKELAGEQPDVFYYFVNYNKSISNVYAYNTHYSCQFGSEANKAETEEDIKNNRSELPKIGYYVGADGHFYPTKKACSHTMTYPVAIVAYLGDTYCVETGTAYNGLAIALKNTVDNEGKNYIISTISENDTEYSTDVVKEAAKDFRGFEHTSKMYIDGRYRNYPAASVVYNNDDLKGSLSCWFIPSAGQWRLAMEGLGLGKFTVVDQALSGADIYGFKDGQPKVAIFNDLELTDDETFFTSTEYPHNNSYGYVWGFAIRKDLEESCFISMVDKQRNSCSLRKFLAFKYSTGGKKDIE